MKDTTCHLGSFIDEYEVTGTCPQGKDFAVKNLITHGGSKTCTKLSCPHKISNTRKQVQVITAGPHIILAVN